MNKLKELLEKLTWTHAIVAPILGLGFFYYMLDWNELSIREDSLRNSQETLTQMEKKIREAKEFERQYDDKKKKYTELVAELQKVQGALPKSFFLPELLSELLRETKQLQIEVFSILPDAAEEQKELYNSLGFTVDARGSFVQFFILLDRLAHMKRLLSVSNVTWQRDGEKAAYTLGGDQGAFASTKLTGGRGLLQGIRASFRIITYRYRGSPANAPAPTGVATPGGGKK